jgi:hypothetical protein
MWGSQGKVNQTFLEHNILIEGGHEEGLTDPSSILVYFSRESQERVDSPFLE